MHLHAGIAHGGLVEYHYPAVLLCRQIFGRLPEPDDGYLTMPNTPGLGFAPDAGAVRDLARNGTSHGRGKG